MANATITQTLRRGNRKVLFLFEKYKAAHPAEGDEIKPHLVAPWALREGLWKRPPMEPEEVLRRLLSRALRDEYIVDPQGREVRKHHPVITEVRTSEGTKRLSTWYTIFEAPPEKMRASLQLRRRAALADVMQLKFDFDSYNENNRHGSALTPMDFDFNKDIEELSQPVTYPNEAPNEENEGEETEEDLVL